MFRLLAEHLDDVVLVTEREVIVWASPSAAGLLGVDPQVLVGRMVGTLVHPADRNDLVVTPQAPTMRGRGRVVTADGSLRWVDGKVTARFGPTGQVEAVYHVLRDIQAQVELEEQLAASRRRTHDALDASPDGFAIYQADRDQAGMVTGLRLSFINAHGAAGFAGDASTLVGRDLRDFYPDAVGNGLWADLITALGTGQPQHTHVEVSGPSWAGNLHGIQVRLDADTVMSTWRDVSDQVRTVRELAAAHAQIAEAQATLQTALDATSDGFLVMDVVRDDHGRATGLRIATSNRAATAARGLTPDQVHGLDPADFSDTWPGTGLWELVLSALADGAARTRRVRIDLPGPQPDQPDRRGWVAQDHTIAPVGPDRVVLTFRDVTDDERARIRLEDARRQAEHAAARDPLTGLPNRALLHQRIHEALTHLRHLDHVHDLRDPADRGHGEQIGIVFCDLDGFKTVNDTYGHAAGDTILRTVADRLHAMIRPHDTVARIGGDEFVILLRHLPRHWQPGPFLTRTTTALRQPVAAGDTLLIPSASLGIHLTGPHHPGDPATTDPDTLIAAADHAMYRAKHGDPHDHAHHHGQHGDQHGDQHGQHDGQHGQHDGQDRQDGQDGQDDRDQQDPRDRSSQAPGGRRPRA